MHEHLHCCLQDADAIAEAERKASSLGFLAADWAFCAATFILSDILYLQGAHHFAISAILAATAAANWKLFDGTKPGKHSHASRHSSARLCRTQHCVGF